MFAAHSVPASSRQTVYVPPRSGMARDPGDSAPEINATWMRFATAAAPQSTAGGPAVSQPGDPAEREAERIADEVMRAPDKASVASPREHVGAEALQRKCPACDEEEIQRKESPGAPAPQPAGSISAAASVGSGGRPMDDGTRGFFESRLGADLRDVRIHDDSEAARSAHSVSALAFTVGEHVAFGAGHYRPETDQGKRLLAHELVHVLQNRQGSGASNAIQRHPQTYHEGVVTIVWDDDSAEVYRRIVRAVDRSSDFPGIPASSMWQPFHDPAIGFHRRHSARHPLDLNEGDRVQVHVSGFHDPEAVPGMSNVYIWHDEDIPAPMPLPSLPQGPPLPEGYEDDTDDPETEAETPTFPSTPSGCTPAQARRAASECTPNPGGAHLPPVGGTHTESHAFSPCTMTEAEVAASARWCVDSQQAHGGEVCYREIPLIGGGPGRQFCYSENCCHDSSDDSSVVDPGSPGSGSCCENNYWAFPEHVIDDVLPELWDDPCRVLEDTTGRKPFWCD